MCSDDATGGGPRQAEPRGDREGQDPLSSLARDQEEDHHARHDEEGVGLHAAGLREAQGAADEVGGAGNAALG
jgi:hypothetical protein